MLGKLTQLKWTAGNGTNRDMAFAIIILGFGVVLVAKLAPYYRSHDQTVAYNKVQTTPTVPKSFLERLTLPLVGGGAGKGQSDRGSTPERTSQRGDRPSILERPLFDGEVVLLRVRSMNAYSSTNTGQPIEVQVIGPAAHDDPEIDFSPAIGGKLIGAGSADLSAKRLTVSFSELISSDGTSYAVHGQAVGSADLSPGVEGNYSSGLLSRLAGIALDRTITAADQVGTSYLFSSIGPTGVAARDLQTAAMDTNEQASQNISAEATQGLRNTTPEIDLPAGTIFLARVQASQRGTP